MRITPTKTELALEQTQEGVSDEVLVQFRRTSLTVVLIIETSQSRQHVDTGLIHIESHKSPTAELFDVDSGRIFIHHYEY
ncbi:hypothetical protein Tco_0211552 [Tanacetum coccineum]